MNTKIFWKDPEIHVTPLNHPVPNERHFAVGPEQFQEVAFRLKDQYGAHLSLMFATDDRERTGTFQIYTVFCPPVQDEFWILILAVDPGRPEFPSLTPLLPSAHWYEREIRDMFGLTPTGHPDLRRLILHADWPEGIHPLRKDFPITTSPPRVSGEYPFHRVEGEGIFEIPVGPVHAGIIEPGHFRFSSIGEVAFLLDCQFGYKHRGFEKLAEGLPLDAIPALAEKLSGTSSVSHCIAACQAIERLSGMIIPRSAALIRTLLLELERIYNHIGDVGNMCAGTGLSYGSATGSLIKEHLLQLNERITGSRFLRGISCAGGVTRGLTRDDVEGILQTLDGVETAFHSLCDFLLTSSSHLDRLETTGTLRKDIAEDLGVVGVSARASGINRDTRRDHPHASYAELPLKVIMQHSGDVLARNLIRIDETDISIGMIREVLELILESPGDYRAPLPPIPAYRSALGYTETPRGEALHFLMSGPGNTVFRYKVRTPSYCNWPAIPFLFEGEIIPDFPLCNKSLNLSYAGTDL